MLRVRVLTALILLAVFLPALFWLPQREWAILMALMAGVAAWEWAGFMRLSGFARRVQGMGLFLFCLAWAVAFPATTGVEALPGGVAAVWPLWVGTALFWIAVVPVWMVRRWVLPGNVAGFAVGCIVIFPCWLAIVQLRLLGPLAFLAIVAVVWLADIAAYFFGCNFGRHKLAPSISPGKTWEGALGAAAAVLVYGFVMRALFGLEASPWWLWAIGLVAVTAVSILGDLFESLQKRLAGLKDSSGILPGHGGVLDRIDSLTSTLPLVALFHSLAV